MGVQSFRYQRGAATVLMSILVGFSITAMGLALMFNVQSAQDKQITAQAQVNAQSIAWAGSEAFRQVLAAMPAAELDKLIVGSEFINADGANNKLHPRVANIQPGKAKGSKEITIDLVATDPVAQVGTRLQVVYNVLEAATPPKLPPPDGSTFNFDANLQGTVGHEGAGEKINVNGNFEITSSVTGVSSVFATGDVKVEVNKILLKDIFANGKVFIQSSGTVADSVVGLAGVEISEGFAGSVFSNTYVKYKSSKPAGGISEVVTSVESAGYIDIDNLGRLPFTALRSNGYTTISSDKCEKENPDKTKAKVPCFAKVESQGKLTADPTNIENAFSADTFICNGDGQPGTAAQAPSFGAGCSVKPPSKFVKSTPVISPVAIKSKRDLTPLPIDVWDQEPHANYVVRFDKTLNGNVVTVKNVKRLTASDSLDGQYGLVRKDKDSDGYLCPIKSTSFDAASQELVCSEKLESLFCTAGCWERAEEDRVLDGAGTKDTSGKILTYRLKGYVAPGVILFDGNLVLKHAVVRLSAAALLAAGYITTEDNNSQIAALNFAGADGGAVKDAKGVELANLPGVCSNLAGGKVNLIPTNFCLPTYNSAAANNLGNVALMAGGQLRSVTTKEAKYNSSDLPSTTIKEEIGQLGRTTQTIVNVIPDAVKSVTITETTVKQPYYGGDIRIAAFNVVYGSILAGNLFKSEGTSKVYGYVVSSALAKSPKGGAGAGFNAGGLQLSRNELGASTTLDHTVTRGEFNGNVLPNTSNPKVDPPLGSGDKVQVLRARYL